MSEGMQVQWNILSSGSSTDDEGGATMVEVELIDMPYCMIESGSGRRRLGTTTKLYCRGGPIFYSSGRDDHAPQLIPSYKSSFSAAVMKPAARTNQIIVGDRIAHRSRENPVVPPHRN